MTVTVDLGAALTAHVSGIRRCGSPWSCLLCSPIIRERRAAEIDTGVSGHLERGGGAEFVTLTLRHARSDRLAARLDVITTALASCLSGASWARWKERLGYVGTIRAVEVTDGVNGWHPHLHALFLWARQLTAAERSAFGSWLRGRWAKVVERRGFGTINEHGTDVRPVLGAGDLAKYLCKVESGWGVGLELTRSDLKSNSPLRHLREFARTGDMAHGRRWQEYEAATFGKRALRWSPNLRRQLLGHDQEQSDQELASSEGIDLTLLRAVMPRERWDGAVRTGQASALLSEIEAVGALLLALTPNPQPLEDSRVGA